MRWLFIAALLLAGCSAQSGLPPLVKAARDGRPDLIGELAKQGVDLNARSGVNGWTPLMHAIHKDQKASVVALLDAGADVNARSSEGVTSLMMAAGYGNAPIINLLLDRGADARAQLKNGKNALTLAVIGVPDADRFTLGSCQVPAAMAIARRAPGLKLTGVGQTAREILAAKLKGCMAISFLMGSR